MATIDYKEKYEQALERARQFFEKPYLEDSAGIVGYIFPELSWSEDERIRKRIIHALHGDVLEMSEIKEAVDWLEKQGKKKSEEEVDNLHNYLYGEQKPADKKGMNLVEDEMAPFQKKVFCIIDTTIEEEQGLKQVCDELLALASNEIEQKSAWSEEDEKTINNICHIIRQYDKISKRENKPCWYIGDCLLWMQNIKDRVQPKQEWWKPSDEQMKTLKEACDEHWEPDGLDPLYTLYQDLKKLRDGK